MFFLITCGATLAMTFATLILIRHLKKVINGLHPQKGLTPYSCRDVPSVCLRRGVATPLEKPSR